MRDSKRNFYMKNNFINTYDGPYKKSNMKNNQYDIENERNKDTIIKLKEQIIAKDKEISNLKVSKLKKDEQYYKTIKIIEQIVRNDTPSNNNTKIKNKNKSKKRKNNNNINEENTKRSQTENLRENKQRDNLNQNEIYNENEEEVQKNNEKNEKEEQDLQQKKEEKMKLKSNQKKKNK